MDKIRKLLCLFLLSCWCPASVYALELNRVILSSNNDPLYIEFWPVVAPLWEAMGLRPTLALVGNEHCKVDTSLGDVIRFEPLPDIPESLQAQVIRLLIPAYFSEDVCLIADIDMLPISRTYFVKGASQCPDDGLLIYRDGAVSIEENRYPMCYVAAKGHVFAALFDVYSHSMAEIIRQWAYEGHGWNTDELLLYSYAKSWEMKGGRVVRLGDDVVGRLDRGNWRIDFNTLDITQYIDCHCPRPYSAYRNDIDWIVNKIRAQNSH